MKRTMMLKELNTNYWVNSYGLTGMYSTCIWLQSPRCLKILALHTEYQLHIGLAHRIWAAHGLCTQSMSSISLPWFSVATRYHFPSRNGQETWGGVYFLQLPAMKAVTAIKRMTENSHLLKKTHDGWCRTEACSRWTAPPHAFSNLLTCTLASGTFMFLESNALCRESHRDQ